MSPRVSPPPRLAKAIDDRITPYNGQNSKGDITKRIDEIYIKGQDVHIEMMEPNSAHMRIGKKAFFIGADTKGKLTIRFLWDE